MILISCLPGYVIDLQKTVSISTSSEMFSTRRKHYRRCDMKICVPQGSIKFHLINEDIPKWRDTLMAVHEGFVEKFHTLKPGQGYKYCRAEMYASLTPKKEMERGIAYSFRTFQGRALLSSLLFSLRIGSSRNSRYDI